MTFKDSFMDMFRAHMRRVSPSLADRFCDMNVSMTDSSSLNTPHVILNRDIVSTSTGFHLLLWRLTALFSEDISWALRDDGQMTLRLHPPDPTRRNKVQTILNGYASQSEAAQLGLWESADALMQTQNGDLHDLPFISAALVFLHEQCHTRLAKDDPACMRAQGLIADEIGAAADEYHFTGFSELTDAQRRAWREELTCDVYASQTARDLISRDLTRVDADCAWPQATRLVGAAIELYCQAIYLTGGNALPSPPVLLRRHYLNRSLERDKPSDDAINSALSLQRSLATWFDCILFPA